MKIYGHPLALNHVKVQLLLAEVKRPYEFVEVDIFKSKEHLAPELKTLNPSTRIPFLVEDDGFLLAESHTILRYLAQKWNLTNWYPQPLRARALVDHWLDFAATHICPFLTHLFVFRWVAFKFPGWPMDLRRCDQALSELKRNLPILELQLQRSEYVAGPEPTLVDLALAPFLAVSAHVGLPLWRAQPSLQRRNYPQIARWLTTITARQSWGEVWDGRLPRVALADASSREPAAVGSPERIEDVLGYWFEGVGDEVTPDAASDWFGQSSDADKDVHQYFADDHRWATAGGIDSWLDTPRGRLAAILLLDQFSRHLYRGSAAAYAHDERALQICLSGLEAGTDKALRPIERLFFFMPLVHSEQPAMQEVSVQRFDELCRESPSMRRTLRFVWRHEEIIRRFGRFPHRNRALNRESTAEEEHFLNSEGSKF